MINEIQVKINELYKESRKGNEKNLIKQAELVIEIGELCDGCSDSEKKEIADAIYPLLKEEQDYMIIIFLYTAILQWNPSDKRMIELQKYILTLRDISWQTKYFLYYQVACRIFRYRQLETKETKILKWRMLQEAVIDALSKLEMDLQPISDRDNELVIVLADQILDSNHAPTKTAFGRCKALIEKMGKRVLLINTAESLSFEGAIPFYDAKKALYFEELNNCEALVWDGVSIPYFQYEQNMPNLESMKELLTFIQKYKPAYIISVGGSSLVANLANKMIPVISLSLCFSDIDITLTDYQIVGRNLTDEDREILQEVNYEENQIITSQFTFGLKEQTEHYTRSQLGIPKDQFVIAIIGARLDDEMTELLLNRLESIVEQGYFIVFMGRYETYDKKMERYPLIKKYSLFLGFCSDVLAILECCDIYINPYRKGGGSSCVEAMYMHKPVISIDYGDVATNAGNDFLVRDYDEMFKLLTCYKTDQSFYEEKSKKARERAELLLDGTGAFEKAILEFERREREKKKG